MGAVVDHSIGTQFLEFCGFLVGRCDGQNTSVEGLGELDLAWLKRLDFIQTVPGGDSCARKRGGFDVGQVIRDMNKCNVGEDGVLGQQPIHVEANTALLVLFHEWAANPICGASHCDTVASLDAFDVLTHRDDLAGSVRQRNNTFLGSHRVLAPEQCHIAVV
ncbi:hypothetical protein HG530_014696 [Fusarium avenaceum]|nr:hypothetical protein HG530_014696 [Fusarium avenaceum]